MVVIFVIVVLFSVIVGFNTNIKQLGHKCTHFL